MRLIDADALVEKFAHPNELIYTFGILNEIKNAPTIDAEPVVHAHWIEDGYFGFPNVCSHCGSEWKKKTKRCQNCGAIMDEEVRLNG